MGKTDKLIRIILALIAIGLYYFKVVDGVLGYVILALSFVFILTSIISFCPLYTIFGLKTCKIKK